MIQDSSFNLLSTIVVEDTKNINDQLIRWTTNLPNTNFKKINNLSYSKKLSHLSGQGFYILEGFNHLNHITNEDLIYSINKKIILLIEPNEITINHLNKAKEHNITLLLAKNRDNINTIIVQKEWNSFKQKWSNYLSSKTVRLSQSTQEREQLALEQNIKEATSKKEEVYLKLKQLNQKFRSFIYFISQSESSNHPSDLIDLVIKSSLLPHPIQSLYIFQQQSPNTGIVFSKYGDEIQVFHSTGIPEIYGVHINDNKFKSMICSFLKETINNLTVIPIGKPIKSNQQLLLVFHENSDPQFVDPIINLAPVISISYQKVYNQLLLKKLVKSWNQAFTHINLPLYIFDKNLNLVQGNNNQLLQLASSLAQQYCKSNFTPPQGLDDAIEFEKKLFLPNVIEFKDSKNSLFYLVSLSDITQKHQDYVETIFNQKMAILADLAGHIAHELTNPLSGIIALTQWLSSESNMPAVTKADLIEIEMAARRAEKIIKSLLQFTNQNSTQTSKADLIENIETAILFAKSILRTINLSKAYPKDKCFSNFQPELFQQVIFNLIHNAAQAMDFKGQISINVLQTPTTYMIEIQDNGPGINSEYIDKIFDPLFTTKKRGEGTGLGLSLSKKLIEDWGGRIYAQSELGKGAKFIIQLPNWDTIE